MITKSTVFLRSLYECVNKVQKNRQACEIFEASVQNLYLRDYHGRGAHYWTIARRKRICESEFVLQGDFESEHWLPENTSLIAAAVQWGIIAGRTWELLEGLEEGQTHLDQADEGEMVVWAHPLDVHYACKGITGWPKLHFQIWSQDVHERNDLCRPRSKQL